MFYEWKTVKFHRNFNIKPNMLTTHSASTVKMEGATYSSRGWDRLSMA
jgi:hypothetical protein